MTYKKANVHSFTMPLDEMEGEFDVPRNSAVGVGETDPKDVPTYSHPYKLGDSGSDSKFVPRDSGDGLGGTKPVFAPVEAEKATSGNPDSYFQPYLENKKATPSKFNKTAKTSNDPMKIIAKLRSELEDTRKELRMEKIAGTKRLLAREIVLAEQQSGLVHLPSDKQVMTRVAAISKSANTASLERELMRVRSLSSVSGNKTAESTVSTNEQYQDTGMITGISSIVAGTRFNAPTLSGNRDDALREAMKNNTSLGRLFSDVQANPKEF